MKTFYFLIPFGLMDDIMLYDKTICREELCINVSTVYQTYGGSNHMDKGFYPISVFVDRPNSALIG